MVEKIFPLPFKRLAVIIRLCCFLYILSLILANRPPVYYERDDMGWHEKQTIMYLSDDLFKDSLLKMRQIVNLRRDHDRQVSFNVGMLMGRIREKYRYMLEIYRDIIVSYSNWSVARPPSVRYFRPVHFIIAMEMMHYLELEIDKLVDVIIEEAALDYEMEGFLAGQGAARYRKRKSNETKRNKTEKKPKPQPLLRGGNARRAEEAEKSLIRQRYLMKKLGLPINMTTRKKRFIRHWPVEDTWQLDKYNYHYK